MRRPGNVLTQRVPHVFELCTESGAREGVEDEVDGVVGVHQDVHHGPDHLEMDAWSEYNTIQLDCLCVEKFAFWLIIYMKTLNTVNNKTSTTQ